MNRNEPATTSDDARRLEDAATRRERSALRDFLAFLGENKKWWLLPIVIMLLVLALLVVLAGTGAGPFVYPLF